MVRLHVWDPATLADAVTEGIMPDLGHVALEVVDTDVGQTTTYLSFWPEPESLMGRAIGPFKPRATRHPASYTEETEPKDGFMQRPADHTVEITDSLNETRIQRLWPLVRDSAYDLQRWNCSSVCKYALLSAMRTADYEAVKEHAVCTPEDLRYVTAVEDLGEVLLYLSTSGFVDCRPDDVYRLVTAYNKHVATSAKQEADAVAAA